MASPKLAPCSCFEDKITAITRTLETKKEDILEQFEATKMEIKTAVQEQMQKEERELMKELEHVTNEYLSTAVCSIIQDDNLQPLEETKLKFVKSASIVEACQYLGSVVRYGQFKATGNKTSFVLSSAAPLSSEQVSCLVSPVADPTLLFKCAILQVTPGSFEARYPPYTTGPHQLRVQVGGTDILDTPRDIQVMPRKAGLVFHNVPNPRGLAISREGHLVVAEVFQDCITIIDPSNGKRIRTFGQSGSERRQFNCPVGLAVTKDSHIVVADFGNDRLQVLTAEGAFIDTADIQPKIINPYDVAIHHNGKIFVTCFESDCVQVLNGDFSYSHCFGGVPGPLEDPLGIAIDANGIVYVADHANNRIVKFTPEGMLLDTIDSNEGEGKLNQPNCLYIDSNGILFVSERGSNTVKMFTCQGRFLGYLGNNDGSSFTSPKFIISDHTGRIYVSDINGLTTW